MAQIIKADGTVERVAPTNPPHFSLTELQAAVGGYIEHVALAGKMSLLVNEDGIRLNLPPNARASQIAGTGIVGDALLIAGDEWE